MDKEDEAKEIIAQIKKGGSFEKLAGREIQGPGLARPAAATSTGRPPERYVKPFGDALTKLKKGQMTDAPVQTQFGWHIIRLDDERATQVPTFDEAKPQI